MTTTTNPRDPNHLTFLIGHLLDSSGLQVSLFSLPLQHLIFLCHSDTFLPCQILQKYGWPHATTFYQPPSDHYKEDRKLGKIYFYQREIITKLFPNTTRGLFEKNSIITSTYWHMLLLKVKLRNQGHSKIFPELNKRQGKFS